MGTFLDVDQDMHSFGAGTNIAYMYFDPELGLKIAMCMMATVSRPLFPLNSCSWRTFASFLEGNWQ